jgi:hypothetical protein
VALVITAVNFLTLPVAIGLAYKLAGAKISWFAMPIWPALVASALAAAAVLLLQQQLRVWEPLWRLVACVSAGSLAYAAIIATLDPRNTIRRACGMLMHFRNRSFA